MRKFDSEELLGKTCKLQDGIYRISKYLGSGGIGVTYLAESNNNGNVVCIKVLNPEAKFNNQRIEHRFCHEVNIARGLSHENLVKVFELGKIDNLHYFYSMEYCPGGNFKEFLRERERIYFFSDIWFLFVQICDVLSYIHNKGYIHRDLKPDNILLEEKTYSMDKSTKIKLSDFGTFYSFKDEFKNLYTYSNDIIGSLVYISPEQRLDKKLNIQSDIYSLGIILYQLLIRDTFEYRLKPLKAIRGLEDNQILIVQNIINKMCDNDLKFRYKSIEEVLRDFKVKLIDKDSYLLKNLEISNFLLDEEKSIVNLDFPESNIYHNLEISISKYEKEIWRFPDAEEINDLFNFPTEAIVKDNLVFNGWDSGHITSTFLSTGDLNWYQKISDDEIFSTPACIKNICIVIDTKGKLMCLDIFTGNILWNQNLDGDFTCPLKIIGTNLYVISNNGKIFEVATANGEVLRVVFYENINIKRFRKEIFTQSISYNNSLFFLSSEKIVGIPDVNEIYTDENRYKGWHYDCPYTGYNKHTWGDDGLAGFAFDGRYLYVTTFWGMVMCVDMETGTSVWRIETDEDMTAGPFVNEDLIVFVTCVGNIYICDKNTGASLRKRYIGERSNHNNETEYGTPIIKNDNVLVFGKYSVQVFDNSLKKAIFSDEIGEEFRHLPTFSGDILIISSFHGVQAFK